MLMIPPWWGNFIPFSGLRSGALTGAAKVASQLLKEFADVLTVFFS